MTDWVRRTAAPNESAAARLTGGWPAHRTGEEPWLLFLSGDGETARSAAETAAGPVLAPPDISDLPLLLHELPEAAGTVLLADLHRAFPCRAAIRRPGKPEETPPPPALATPAYVLARLERLGVGRLVASAKEDDLVRRASDLLAGRGAACRFEVKREEAPPASPAAVSGPDEDDLARAGDPANLRRIALHAPELPVRARAAERAVEADPEHPLSHLLAGCSLAERKKSAEAAAAIRAATERDDTLAAAHFELGKAMIVLDDLEAALASFRRATETLPEFAPGWANAGAALGELERPGEALADIERAAGLDPLSHSLVSNLGVTLRDLGRLEEAEAAFRRALDLAPDFVFGRYNLANVVYLRGRHEEAVGLFERAREMDPTGSARQRLLLAVARVAAGDADGALADYGAVFGALEGQMRVDMRTVAQWDLRRLAERIGVTPPLRRAAEFVRGIA